jgi:LytTr DNA-binding domain
MAFIENAFKYAGYCEDRENKIEIVFRKHDDDLEFTAFNTKESNGTGDLSHKGIGIANAKRRLELLYPGKYRLDINNQEYSLAVNKARDFYELKNQAAVNAKDNPLENYFFVKCEGRIEKVLYEDLIYIEAMLNYVVLHTGTRKMIVYLTIKGIAEQLPAGIFLKVHKSTIVNINKIRRIAGNELDMGIYKVVISQSLQETVMKEILKDKMIKR